MFEVGILGTKRVMEVLEKTVCGCTVSQTKVKSKASDNKCDRLVSSLV